MTDEIMRMADRTEARSRGDGADGAAKEFVEIALSEGEIDAEIRKLAALPEGVTKPAARQRWRAWGKDGAATHLTALSKPNAKNWRRKKNRRRLYFHTGQLRRGESPLSPMPCCAI